MPTMIASKTILQGCPGQPFLRSELVLGFSLYRIAGPGSECARVEAIEVEKKVDHPDAPDEYLRLVETVTIFMRNMR